VEPRTAVWIRNGPHLKVADLQRLASDHKPLIDSFHKYADCHFDLGVAKQERSIIEELAALT
jgi:hypothetical protein